MRDNRIMFIYIIIIMYLTLLYTKLIRSREKQEINLTMQHLSTIYRMEKVISFLILHRLM